MEYAIPERLTLLIRRTIVPTSLSIAAEQSVPDVKASEGVCSDAGNQNCLPLYWTLWKMKGLADDCPVRIDPRDVVPRPCRDNIAIQRDESTGCNHPSIIAPVYREGLDTPVTRFHQPIENLNLPFLLRLESSKTLYLQNHQ